MTGCLQQLWDVESLPTLMSDATRSIAQRDAHEQKGSDSRILLAYAIIQYHIKAVPACGH